MVLGKALLVLPVGRLVGLALPAWLVQKFPGGL